MERTGGKPEDHSPHCYFCIAEITVITIKTKKTNKYPKLSSDDRPESKKKNNLNPDFWWYLYGTLEN